MNPVESTETISLWQAFVLGIVEGLTEYLPVSSTGHLVITSDLIGLRDLDSMSAAQVQAVQAFEIVIQSGAILAVLWLYRVYVWKMIQGIFGRSVEGQKLFVNVCCATLPILVVGFLSKDLISNFLQFSGPVLFALIVGGILMIAFEKKYAKRPASQRERTLDNLSWKDALMIGGIQCFALWPGTSRSMVTIVGGMLVGLKRPAAAEFSFLIALPALLAATAYKALKEGDVIIQYIGWSSVLVGLVTSTVFALIAVKWLVSFLNKNGLSVFGWYRIILAVVLYAVVGL